VHTKIIYSGEWCLLRGNMAPRAPRRPRGPREHFFVCVRARVKNNSRENISCGVFDMCEENQ